MGFGSEAAVTPLDISAQATKAKKPTHQGDAMSIKTKTNDRQPSNRFRKPVPHREAARIEIP
jgi:hypothetical protein